MNTQASKVNEQMKTVKYQLRVKGLATPDGTISVRALLGLLGGLTDCAERSLRLAVEGTSIKSGRQPSWLEKAVNFTMSGLKSGSTVLNLEAPTLAEVIGTELQQQDFWAKAPAPHDTAISLIAQSVRDTTAENLESDYYDAGVLKSLLNLKPFLKTQAQSLEVVSQERPQEHIVINNAEMEKVERLKIQTPEPQSFIVSGHLDAIQHSQKRFQLVLPESQIIPGRVDEEFMAAESLREFWGKDVTVKGIVHFRPSGRIQLLEAQFIKIKNTGEEIFEVMPRVQTEAEFIGESLHVKETKNWLKEVWGKWPGDEPVEDILKELKH